MAKITKSEIVENPDGFTNKQIKDLMNQNWVLISLDNECTAYKMDNKYIFDYCGSKEPYANQFEDETELKLKSLKDYNPSIYIAGSLIEISTKSLSIDGTEYNKKELKELRGYINRVLVQENNEDDIKNLLGVRNEN